MKRTHRWIPCLCLLALILVLAPCGLAAPTISEKTTGMVRHAGFFTFFWDAAEGRVWLEIPDFEREFLYVNGLSTGIGSNDLGFDRTQLGDEQVVLFRRVGPRILLVEPNLIYRADESAGSAERRTVREGFAESVLWGFEVAAEQEDHVLIDLTPMLLADHRRIPQTLARAKEGQYAVDPSRSAVYLERTRSFPKNTEFDVTLTFRGTDPGPEIRSVVPTPELFTIREHHSFIQLPDSAYRPRPYHVMSGYWPVTYQDYTVPLGRDLTQRFIARHRLRKKDPTATVSDPVQPIVYYLDPGVPEPIRDALIEGGRWWSQAFEAIGYRNAFRIEMLPDDADPMDVRYNVINWLHRSTRGWSYGETIIDPRTGEILKGHVNLGSLRVRQDYLIAEGLLAPYGSSGSDGQTPLAPALARIRQLAAHEIGHTLGLTHNFAASTTGRASVMDYPHPRVTLDAGGRISMADAYATGMGEWDKMAIAYGYQDFPPGTDEPAALDEILRRAYRDRGLRFISDQDARPEGGLHPYAHLWDDGSDPIAELTRLLEVRRVALSGLNPNALRPGRPMATLEEVLVPIYYLHRYQVEAVSKWIGGLEYEYSLRGGWQQQPRPVTPEDQHRALETLLGCLSPRVLEIPPSLSAAIPPRPPGYPATRELFPRRTGPAFDPIAAAEASAGTIVRLLLNPARVERLIQAGAADPRNLGLVELIDGLIDASWKAAPASGSEAEVQEIVDGTVLHGLLALSRDVRVSVPVRAVTLAKLQDLRDWLSGRNSSELSYPRRAIFQLAVREIDRRLAVSEQTPVPAPEEMPPGQPIG
ncbi:MAG: zinc-dependent metalloprotease [Acidobacteriota bacterium]